MGFSTVGLMGNMVWASGLAGISDVLAQVIEGRFERTKEGEERGKKTKYIPSLIKEGELTVRLQGSDVSVPRTMRFMILPGMLGGALASLWYTQALAPLQTGAAWKTILMKDLLDNTAYPALCYPALITGSQLIQGETMSTALDRVKQDFPPAFFASFLLWFPLDIITFSMVPTLVQAPLVQFVDIVAQAFLSFLMHRRLNPAHSLKY